MRLSALFEERGEAYANANARVSLESMSINLIFCFETKIVELSRICGKEQEKALCVFTISWCDVWSLIFIYFLIPVS